MKQKLILLSMMLLSNASLATEPTKEESLKIFVDDKEIFEITPLQKKYFAILQAKLTMPLINNFTRI